MSRATLLGDSHVVSYLKAIDFTGRGDLLTGYPLGAATTYFEDFFHFDGCEFSFNHPRLDRNYQTWKIRTGCQSLLDCKGNLFISMGMSGPSFWGSSFWRGVSTQPSSSKRFTSSGALNFFVESAQEHTLRFYKTCIDQGLLAGVIAAPAPQRRAQGVKVHGPTELLRLDRLFGEPIRQFLESRDVPVIDLGMTDSDGFLKAEFEGDDPYHCGVACAPLLVEAIERIFPA